MRLLFFLLALVPDQRFMLTFCLTFSLAEYEKKGSIIDARLGHLVRSVVTLPLSFASPDLF